MPALSKPSGMPESEWLKLQSDNHDYAKTVSDAVGKTTETTTAETKPVGMPTSAWEAKQKAEASSSTSSATGTTEPSNYNSKLNIDTTSYDASKNQTYYDATNPNKQTSAPESGATGSGIDSAVGTEYSWNKNAKELAEKTYAQKVLEERQGLLTNRQTLEQNAQQYQTESDMKKYQDNQTADKVGWTGGYVLDQEQQREYLKASIQAQLYGAMELQKYGYDTSLAAARLAYDANMLQYAQEYYNQAVQTAINEAQVTGTYFSAEVKDMLGQWKVAQAKLTENENDAQASEVVKNIKTWFESNGISDSGIKTLEAWQAEQSLELSWQQELWTQYNAAYETALQDINKSTTFIMVDSQGNPMYDGNNVKTVDMETMSESELASYAASSTKARDQVASYFNYLQEEIRTSNSTTDSDGNVTYNTDKINSEYQKLKARIDNINNNLPENSNKLDTTKLDKAIDKNNNPNTTYTKEQSNKTLTEIFEESGISKYFTIKGKSLSTSASEVAFGDFVDTGKSGTGQSNWVNGLQELAKAGAIKDGTIVNMNVGAGEPTLYAYSNGYWQQLSINHISSGAFSGSTIKEDIQHGTFRQDYYFDVDQYKASGDDWVTATKKALEAIKQQ